MKYIKNEEAVSPVLGVILMVAITVIVATIIAVFMFGVGEPDEAPQAKLKITALNDGTTNTTITLKHEGGDPLLLRECLITVTDADTGNALSAVNDPLGTGGTLTPGNPVTYSNMTATSSTGTILEVMIMDEPTGQLLANVQVVVR